MSVVKLLSIWRPGIILFFLILIFLPPPLGARGQKEEDPLLLAAELIEAKKFNEAILILTQVAKEDPHRFDEVQIELRKIRSARETINEKYEQLLDTFEVDLEEAYVIIKDLEDLDPYPNDRSRDSIIRARETAGFVYNRNRWEQIMEAALALLIQGEYRGAVEKYTEGFNLSRDIFEDAGYGLLAVEQADRQTESLRVLINQFYELIVSLQQHRDQEARAYSTALGSSGTAYAESFTPLIADISEMSALLTALQETSRFYLNYEESLRLARGDGKEVHHLIYLALLISGRPGIPGGEGIFGTLGRLWTATLTDLEEHTETLLARRYQSGLDGYGQNQSGQARLLLQECRQLIGLNQQTLDAWSQPPAVLRGGTAGEEDFLAVLADREEVNRLRDVSAEDFLLMIDQGIARDDIHRRAEAVETYQQGQEIRRELREAGALLRDRRDWWTETEAGLLASSAPPENAAARREVSETTGQALDSLLDSLEAREIALVVHMEGFDRAPLHAARDALSEQLFQARGYLDGQPLVVGTSEILAPYPDRALTLLNPLPAEIARISSSMTTLQLRLGAEPFQDEPEIAALLARGRQLLEELASFSAQITSLQARAEQEVFLANRFRQEGNQRLLEARRLVNQGEFAGAKERLTASSDRFDQSLIHQEDPALRRIRDNDIPALFEEIREAENRLVIQQVRQYLTQGQSLYSQNDFAAANSLFLRAETRWADTNGEPNPEVTYWLELTRTALSVTTGREILRTDPLYAEMFQYLNRATEDFERGRRLLSVGQTAEANRAFDNAEQNLLLVQQFFPFNKDARVLTIRIAQQRDPQGFVELFRKDFLEAREKIATSPQEAYVELKDLEALEPRYPGLQAAIEEAEYATGIKVRPPDPARIARANDLLQRAQQIVNNNARTEFPVALAFLDEALTLNPGSQAAIRLKDTVAIAMGGTTTTVLSSADQQRYAEAVAEFTAGNYLRAQIMVDILLSNPDNRNNTRLLELKERIQSAQ